MTEQLITYLTKHPSSFHRGRACGNLFSILSPCALLCGSSAFAPRALGGHPQSHDRKPLSENRTLDHDTWEEATEKHMSLNTCASFTIGHPYYWLKRVSIYTSQPITRRIGTCSNHKQNLPYPPNQSWAIYILVQPSHEYLQSVSTPASLVPAEKRPHSLALPKRRTPRLL